MIENHLFVERLMNTIPMVSNLVFDTTAKDYLREREREICLHVLHKYSKHGISSSFNITRCIFECKNRFEINKGFKKKTEA